MDKKTKKSIYIGLWLAFGALVGTLVSEAIQLYVLQTGYEEMAETLPLIYGILIAGGVIVAAILGPIAWKKIYVQGLRGKKYIVKN